MQEQLKLEMRAALRAEEIATSPEGKPAVGRTDATDNGATPGGEVQARVAELEAAAIERGAELEVAEEEKYLLSSDLEVLQEELEDANQHQKRYYEALMSKEQQLREMRSSCAALQKAVRVYIVPLLPP